MNFCNNCWFLIRKKERSWRFWLCMQFSAHFFIPPWLLLCHKFQEWIIIGRRNQKMVGWLHLENGFAALHNWYIEQQVKYSWVHHNVQKSSRKVSVVLMIAENCIELLRNIGNRWDILIFTENCWDLLRIAAEIH